MKDTEKKSESDLFWLARNVHEWPGNDTTNVVNTFSTSPDGPSITKDQWLAERARIQNKPSWDDATDDAEWLAQDLDGIWSWYWKEPCARTDNDQFCGSMDEGYICLSNEGEVLGDWRNTLERRPNADTAPDPEEYTGKSVSYYTVTINKPTNPDRDPYDAECNDIIEALGMSYAEGNAFKAIWRRCAARTLGKAKRGYTDGLYDADKAHFFAGRMVAQETD